MKLGNMTRWLDVEVGTDEVDLNTLPSNICLVDLHSDNEFKLLIGDLGRGEEGPKLRTFKGAMQISDMVLPDLPLGVVSLYTSEASLRSTPIVAVAFNTSVYMFRNMKLFYKYYVPAFEPTTCEMDAWTQLLDQTKQNLDKLPNITESLSSIPTRMLSTQSRNFLALNLDQQLEYLEQNPEIPVKKETEIACITTLRMSSVDRYSVSCLVVGTEDGYVNVLDPQVFTELSQAKLCTVKKTPYQIVATGLYSVDYRLTVATREKTVCLLKRDWPEGRILFTTEDHIIAIEVATTDSSVTVICADNTMACYSKKGKKLWSINLEHRPVAMTLVPVQHLGLTLTAVSLASGHVQLYSGKAQADSIFVRDVVSVMKFGQLGQEEHVLIVVTGSCTNNLNAIQLKTCVARVFSSGTYNFDNSAKIVGGNLMLKILKRTADFDTHAAGVDTYNGAAIDQKPWLIPKKSKLFIEQSLRERENASAMHEMFQYELNRLRLTAAKTLLDAHVKSDNSVGAGNMESMRLTAEVEGLGPVFRVTLIIENTSADKAVVGLAILFHAHTINYKVSNPYIKVPLLSPGGKLQFPTKIEEVFDENINPDVLFRPVTGQAGDRTLVKILLLKEGRRSPVLAATVQMPPTDPMMLPFDKIQSTANAWDNDAS